jgi:hypothetical protein
VNTYRDTARRWVIDEGKTDEEIGHLIVVTYDAGPERIAMHGYVNEARAEVNAAPSNLQSKLVLTRAAARFDVEREIRLAVADLLQNRQQLRWKSVVTWMQHNTPGCESLTEKTLRRYRSDLELSDDVRDPIWRTA